MSDSNTTKPRHDGQGDNTEIIELLVPEHQLLTFALLAHEQDITLNEWFMNAVMDHLDFMDGKHEPTIIVKENDDGQKDSDK